MADNQVDLKLNLDFKGVNDALYQMIGQFNGTDKEFQKIADSIEKNAKNLEAAIKLFGPASQQASNEIKKLQKDFQNLVAQGIDPASDSFKQMSASIPKPSTIDASTGAVKKTNQQYTNLALVLQDLPYGFRGIQNNLPALIGGMAGVTGAFYLAASAAIALYTAYDMGLFKSKEATQKAKEKTEALKKQQEATDSLYESTGQEAAQVGILISVLKNETETRDRKLTALEDLKKISPEIFNGLTLEKNAVIGLDEAYKNYLENLGTIIAVKTKQAELESVIAKRLKAQGATLSQEEKDIAATGAALDSALNTKRTDLELRTRSTKQQGKEAKSQVYINGLKQQEEKILRNIQQLSKGVKLKEPKTDTKKSEVDTTVLDRLKKQQKLYKDDIGMFYQYGKEIIKEEEKVAIQKAIIEGKSAEQIKEIRKGFEADSLANQQEFGKKIMEEADKNTKELEKVEKQGRDKILENTKSYYENRLKYAFDDLEQQKIILTQELAGYKFLLDLKIIDDIAYANKAAEIYKALGVIKNKQEQDLYKSQVYFSNQRIKNIQSRLDIELKQNRNNVGAQQEIIKQAMAEVGALAYSALNPEALQQFLEFFNKLDGKLKGTTERWQSFSQGISSSISGFLADSFTALAENIGNALSGGEIKPLEHFQKLLADALINIGKMLIQYGTLMQIALGAPDPFVAIAAGVGAIALGTIIKNRLKQSAVDPTAFANGGIVSGPTMGLMGEYPGAQNNPEVIAPLDKLKDLIGGGGSGQFVLRGQDLVLAMQRSNSSLNIRRG